MQRRKRNIVIGILFCTLVFMGVGYAFLTKVIDITSLGIISSKWKIVITNVTVEEKYGYTSDEKMEYEGNNAELNATFRAPGDWIEFKIRVENQGTIDAVIEEVVVDQTNKEYIAVEVKGIEANERLNAEAYKEFIVRLSVKSTLTSLPNQDGTYETGVTIGLNYKQAGAPTGSDSGSESTVCYLKDVDGSILYNYACGTEAVVPATTEDGTPITSISAQMFARKNVAIFSGYSDTMGQEITGGIIYDDENFDTIKSFLEMAEANGQLPVALPTLYRVSELEGLELSTDTKIQIAGYLDLETFELLDPQKQLTKLDLSQATFLTTIKDSAFASSKLETVIFGDNSNLTTIGNYAFSKNKLGGELIIPASVTTIGNSTFEGSASTNQISKLTFEEGSQLTTIGSYAFYSNSIADQLTLPNGLVSIGASAFYNNKIGKKLILPESLNSLGMNAFGGNLIEELQLSSSLTSIEQNAFINNQISGKLVIPASVTYIGDSAFNNNKITNLTIPNDNVASTAFLGNNIIDLTVGKCERGCSNAQSTYGTNIENLTVNGGYIGDSAFASNAIKILNLDGVSSIGSFAFNNNRITKLIIPASVEQVSGDAFSNNVITELTIEKCSLYNCSNSTYDTVYTKYGSSIETLTINGGDIPDYAFRFNKVKNLNLSGVTTIGSLSFYKNQLTGELIIPASVTTIGESAFGGSAYSDDITNAINKVTFEDGSHLTTIGTNAFDGNNIVGELTIPDSVTDIGFGAFSNRSELLTILNLGSNIASVGSVAFSLGSGSIVNIDMTESEFANVALSDSWYGYTKPTIKYKEG